MDEIAIVESARIQAVEQRPRGCVVAGEVVREAENRKRVGVQALGLRVGVRKERPDHRRPLDPRQREQHERARVPLRAGLVVAPQAQNVVIAGFQLSDQTLASALQIPTVDLVAGVPQFRQTVECIGRHEGMRAVMLPPAPRAIVVLQRVQSRNRLVRDGFGTDVLFRQGEAVGKAREEGRRQHARHRLLGAVIRIDLQEFEALQQLSHDARREVEMQVAGFVARRQRQHKA